MIPTAHDIRNFLEGYCIETESTLTVQGTTTTGSAIVTGIDTRKLKSEMRLSGTGIPTGAEILSVDQVGENGQITMDVDATADGTVDITVTYYSVITDDWIASRRDGRVIPYIERVLATNVREVKEVTEYYSGNGSSLLMLNRRPIVELKNITYTTLPTEYETGNLLSSVEAIKEEGILKARFLFNEGGYNNIFRRGLNNIKVTYTYGFSDLATQAPDIKEAILAMTAKAILIHIGSRTGGGSLSGSNWSRQFGDRGKFTDIINELDLAAYSVLRKYVTGVVGA